VCDGRPDQSKKAVTSGKREAQLLNGKVLLGGAAFIVMAGTGAEALAQTTQLQEVIVTSQRREQSLQNVPISVSAVTQKTIVANRVENVHDLTAIAPNLAVKESPGGVNLPVFAMRGLQSNGSPTGSDKEISMYLDGVYIGSPTGAMFDIADLARIEVLKGPQGTLFGRNSTGGAISITTRDPLGRFHVHEELTGGNLDQFRSKTRIDTPTWNNISASFTYLHSQMRGPVANSAAGTVWDYRPVGYGIQVSPKWLGSHNINAVAAAVKWQPLDNVTLSYKFDWAEDHSTPVANGLAAVGYPSVPCSVAAGNVVNCAVAAAWGPSNKLPFVFDRPGAVNNGFDIPTYNGAWGQNFTAVWHASQRVTVKNIFGYRQSDALTSNNIDGYNGGTVNSAFITTPFTIFPGFSIPLGAAFGAFAPGAFGSPFLILATTTKDTTKQWSDEAQIVYDTPWMTLTSGVLHFWSYETHNGIGDDAHSYAKNEYAFEPLIGSVLTPTGIPNAHATNQSDAFYIQPEFHITPKLDFVAGYRITHDHKELYFVTIPRSAAPPKCPVAGALCTFQDTYGDTKPSALLSLDYKITPDIMVYGKYAMAYMSGGASFGFPYLPEIARSWEGGFKSEFFDRRVRLNFAAWTAKYTNQQDAVGGNNLKPVPHPELAVLVINTGNLDARGFEVEGAVVPINGLTLGYGVGYTKEWYTALAPTIGTLGDWFQPVQRPNMTVNLNAEYDSKPVWKDAYVVARLDANMLGRMYINAYAPTGFTLNDIRPEVTQAPATWLINARLALSHISLGMGTAELAIWGKNLTDDGTPEYGVGANFLQSVYWGAPREFGIDLTFDY
jgi:iron complex outermembrane receptor protein